MVENWSRDEVRGRLVVMLFLATDWATISSLVTGAGTLVLAVATFAAVRSSNRARYSPIRRLRDRP